MLLQNLIPWPLPFRINLRIFTNKIKYVSITILTLKQQACIKSSPNSCFFCLYLKGQLNFVSERIKLVYRIKNIRLAFQTSKTKINGPQTSELKSIFKYQLLFHWMKFEKYMIFYTIPWSRSNRPHKLWNTCVVPFAIAELGQTFWCSTHTKIWTRQQLYHCTQRAFESWRYFNVMFINTFSRNKRRKNCEESRCNVNVNVING